MVHMGFDMALSGSGLEEAHNLSNLKNCCAPDCQAKIDGNLTRINAPGSGQRMNLDSGFHGRRGRWGAFAGQSIDIGGFPVADTVNTAPADISNNVNASRIVVRGRRVREIGVGYGRELPFAPGLFLGGNLKLLQAMTGHADFRLLRDDKNSLNMPDKIKEAAQYGWNAAADLGALWDVARTFENAPWRTRLGLVARNINNPSFRQPAAAVAAGRPVRWTLNPQVRLGAAVGPTRWWNFAADLDLTRNLTLLDGVASRRCGFGTEVNLVNHPRFNLPLRAGLSRDLEEPSAGTMLSLGFGLRAFNFNADLGLSVSRKNVTTEGLGTQNSIPRAAFLSLQMSLLFGTVSPNKS